MSAPGHSDLAPRRILVLRIRYLGDAFLLRYPLRALRRAFPCAEIDALVAKGCSAALDDFGFARTLEWPSTSLPAQARLCCRIAAARYDWVLDLTGNDRSAFLSAISRAKLRAGLVDPKKAPPLWRANVYNRPVPHEKIKPHILRQHSSVLESCGVPCDLSPLPPPIAEADAEWAAALVRPLRPAPILHAHLVSRDMQKSLPVSTSTDLLSRWIADGGAVVLSGGGSPEEKEHVRACLAALPPGRALAAGPTTWGQLAALIREASCYLGADTAPSHLADSLEKKMAVFFGPSHSGQWHPINPLAQRLVRPCPCLKSGCPDPCPPGSPGRCLSEISANALYDLLV